MKNDLTSWLNRHQNTEYRVRNFIAGAYVDPSQDPANSRLLEKYSPRDGAQLYSFHCGSRDDVDRAVAVARDSFESGVWSALPLAQRSAVLRKLADLIDRHRETFALYESMDVGKPITNALTVDLPWVIGHLRETIDMAAQLTSPSGSDDGHFAYQHRKPVGVVAGICGWNFPLLLAMFKMAPALMMGNSLVLKPSEFTALSTSLLAELAFEAGVPAGVFNVVQGAGATVGQALSYHADVDLLSFVGSSATGKAIVKAAGESNMKRLILECGGKSPYLVFDDCPDDLEALAEDVVAKALLKVREHLCHVTGYSYA